MWPAAYTLSGRSQRPGGLKGVRASDDAPDGMMSGNDSPRARIISIGGGKGGVGKSIVAGNLAIALAETGARVVLVDADLGAANQHTLFGVDKPSPGIQALLDRQVETLDETATPTRMPNLRLIVGTGSVPGAANINHGQKQRLLRQIRGLDTDFVVLDVGAGTSHNVVDLFDAGDVHIVVVTPQLTSIQNAYAFLKAAVFRLFRQSMDGKEETASLEATGRSYETERADQFLARLENWDPALASRLRHEISAFDVRLFGNMVAMRQELGVFNGVTRMVRDFLGVQMQMLGHIGTSRAIHDSVNRRQPLLFSPLPDPNAQALREAAHALQVSGAGKAATLQGVPSIIVPVAPVAIIKNDPADLLRKEPRIPVSWAAGLERDGRMSAVRVLDVSQGGVGVETDERLRHGDRFNLVFHEPQLQIAVPIIVRNVGGADGRAGLSFDAQGDIADRIWAAARQSTAGRRLAS